MTYQELATFLLAVLTAIVVFLILQRYFKWLDPDNASESNKNKQEPSYYTIEYFWNEDKKVERLKNFGRMLEKDRTLEILEKHQKEYIKKTPKPKDDVIFLLDRIKQDLLS